MFEDLAVRRADREERDEGNAPGVRGGERPVEGGGKGRRRH